MGLLDKWTKKTTKEQLKAAAKKPEVKVEKKTDAEAEVVSAKTKKSGKITGNNHKVLVRPIISEKAAIAESIGVYTFAVRVEATKVQVKKAVKEIYGIQPQKIRMINVEGKNMRFGRNFGKRSDWKKAVVTLEKGQSINIHEGV